MKILELETDQDRVARANQIWLGVLDHHSLAVSLAS